MQELKYIIVKDKASGLLRHYKSDCLHHVTIAHDNGYQARDIIESGLFIDRKLFILECLSLDHLQRRKAYYIGNCLNDYHDTRLKNWLKGRELESYLYYSKKPIGLKDGD